MKRPISATIDTKLLRWIDTKLKEDITYRNKSHLIEIALINLKAKMEDGKKE